MQAHNGERFNSAQFCF